MVLFLYKSSVVFIVISPKWGLFGIINQIYHASMGILMRCLPSGRHSIMIPTLAWHICILVALLCVVVYTNGYQLTMCVTIYAI